MPQQKIIEKQVQGKKQEGITRLFSPGDLGGELKPFVFLDFLSANLPEGFGFGFHPHSGIATLTYQLNVDVSYVDTEGKEGILKARGLEWMQAGGGAWHKGKMIGAGQIEGFQLWVALPAEVENAGSYSQYIEPKDVPKKGGLTVLLGEIQGLKSPIHTPTPMHYADLELKKGEVFHYEVPPSHSVCWAFVYQGEAEVNGAKSFQKVVVFGKQGNEVSFQAHSNCRILFGSAVEHPYPLVNGYSSVHTSASALEKGEHKIMELGRALKAQGKLSSEDWDL